ncbi:MAG: class A beta-lactamase-related serine hydrolase [Gemmatimonadetes bacterium]|nr:class A beta-lactamase-related serine hydrolase [Gemmatimonadota bacterium]
MKCVLVLLPLLAACASAASPATAPAPASGPAGLEAQVRRIIRAAAGDTAEVAVAFVDLQTGDSLLVDAHTPMHAASTMKVPVMMELFRRAEAGEISMDDRVPVRNAFVSIADGGTYALAPGDDSDGELYARVGGDATVRELVERMITRSSNLATNLLIAHAEPTRIAVLMERIGARGMHVLRGVEDIAAFRAGMNNSTTAHALMRVMRAAQDPAVVGASAAREMQAILGRQQFTEMIPAGLPPGTRVANKTGNITRIAHDAAIVYPPGRAPYVLVVMTRGFADAAAAARVGADVSRAVWAHVTR